VFWVAVLPGLLAVTLLLFGLREPEPRRAEKRFNPITIANLERLGTTYWWVACIGAVFTLAGRIAALPAVSTPALTLAHTLTSQVLVIAVTRRPGA